MRLFVLVISELVHIKRHKFLYYRNSKPLQPFAVRAFFILKLFKGDIT